MCVCVSVRVCVCVCFSVWLCVNVCERVMLLEFHVKLFLALKYKQK